MVRKMLCLLLMLAVLCPLALAEGAEPVDPRVQPAIALSFDDGPSEYTQQVLDILAENDCRATFFMVGTAMSNMPEMVKAVYDSGNEIGLHTWRHNNLTKMSDSAIERNLKACQDFIEEQTGITARWLRPPYGAVGKGYPNVYRACNKLRLYIATWSVDSRDWSLLNAKKIYKEVMGQLHNGDILLFHDTHAETVEALRRILPEIKALGYQVLTVDQLLSFRESLSSNTHYYHLDMKHLREQE